MGHHLDIVVGGTIWYMTVDRGIVVIVQVSLGRRALYEVGLGIMFLAVLLQSCAYIVGYFRPVSEPISLKSRYEQELPVEDMYN